MKQNGNQNNNSNKKSAKWKKFKTCALHVFIVFEQGILRITSYEIRIINQTIWQPSQDKKSKMGKIAKHVLLIISIHESHS